MRRVLQGAKLHGQVGQAEIEAGVPGNHVVRARHDIEFVRDAQAMPTSLRGRMGAAAGALVVALILGALGIGFFNMVLYLIHVFSQ